MIEYNPDRIKLARESEGYTQNQLTLNLKSLSQNKLNRIENRQTIPSDEVMKEIADFLGYPISFFQVSNGIIPYIKEYYYRRNLGIPQKQKMAFDAQMTIIAENIDILFEAIEIDIRVPFIDIEDEEITPERVAQKVRSLFSIEKGPIHNIMSVVQKMGIIIHYIEPPFSIKVDGVSFITKNGLPVILINKNASNSRTVFNVCHELGHLIMHYKYMVSDKRDVEDEANRFASEFLMPAESIKNYLYRLDAPKLYGLKTNWKVSIKSLIYRAKFLGCISETQNRRWMMYYNANKWSSNEPFEFEVESPRLLDKVFNIYFDEFEYTKEEMLKLLRLTEKKIVAYYDLPEVKKHFNAEPRKLRLML